MHRHPGHEVVKVLLAQLLEKCFGLSQKGEEGLARKPLQKRRNSNMLTRRKREDEVDIVDTMMEPMPPYSIETDSAPFLAAQMKLCFR